MLLVEIRQNNPLNEKVDVEQSEKMLLLNNVNC